MSLRFAILGLLAAEPLHGYAIQTELEQHFGELCEPSHGEVYRALDALTRDGLVAPATARSGKRPQRKVCSLTVDGRAALERWLVGVPPRPRSRDDTWLRLLVAERVAPALLPRLLDVLVKRLHAELSELETLRRHAGVARSFADLVRALRLVSHIRHTRARGEVLVLCRTTLIRLQSGSGVAELARRLLNDADLAATGDRKGPQTMARPRS
jgi:DNA-binding PadR family transcriptional regulator